VSLTVTVRLLLTISCCLLLFCLHIYGNNYQKLKLSWDKKETETPLSGDKKEKETQFPGDKKETETLLSGEKKETETLLSGDPVQESVKPPAQVSPLIGQDNVNATSGNVTAKNSTLTNVTVDRSAAGNVTSNSSAPGNMTVLPQSAQGSGIGIAVFILF